MKNRFGLTRNIPAKVKRQIRKQSKFGCVLCRNAIYTYEHIFPEFKDAQKHDPNKMCLLCPGCHTKVTKGIYSKERVAKQYAAIQIDNSASPPFADMEFAARNLLKVCVGKSIFHRPRAVFTVDGIDILSFSAPRDRGEPVLLNGTFFDANGNIIFEIKNNEWVGPKECWDLEIVANRIVIKSDPDTVALQLNLCPPNSIEIVEMNMGFRNCRIRTETHGVLMERWDDICRHFFVVEAIIDDADSCIYINTKNPETSRYKGYKMSAGSGIELLGTGMVVGKGNSSLGLRGLLVYPVIPIFSLKG